MRQGGSIRKVSADLDVLRFPAAIMHPFRAQFLNCSLPLSVSQPDLRSPDRLLGVCARCRHWFLIALIPDLTEGILWRLPDIEMIRDLSSENPSAGPYN
jgi:hypothetical protein